MILQALAKYYDRLVSSADSGVAPEGFERKGIQFLVILSRTGAFGGLEDTRTPDGRAKVARTCIVPKDETRTSGDAPHLLWDTPDYVFGKPRPDPDSDPKKPAKRAAKRHQMFIARIRKTFPTPVTDEGVAAVLTFLGEANFSAVFSHPNWMQLEKSTSANVAFRLDDELQLVCERPAVVQAHKEEIARGGRGGSQQCLVTGETGAAARTHTAIKGVRGAKTSGGHIVSFNLAAFRSQCKKQGLNAPVGSKAEHAYTTALNKLLEWNSQQKMQIGNATAVFWAEKPHPIETWFSDFFRVLPKDVSLQDTEAIRALFRAPQTGALPLLDDQTRFYVLGLSPNGPRLAVRFWYAGTVSKVVEHIKQHFEDCGIVHRDNERELLPLSALLRSTAIDGDDDKVQPNLAGDMMKSILAGTPYPATLLSAVIRRIKAEQSKKRNGKATQNVTYPRASLIKACLARDSRYYKRNQKEVNMSLDPTNTNIGYRLGRLFAVLEKIQEEANPRINATIRDRFYGAASSTPVTGFFVPMKLKNHHLAKLENRGRAVNLDRLIGEVMDGISDFPPHLSLQDQGRFAVGYYHQRQALFTKKTATKEE